MSRVQRRCKRVVVTAKSNMGHSFVYQCPVSKVDRKREGKTLVVSDGRSAVSLDGFGLRMLKRVLKDSGEHGHRVNHKRAKIMVLDPSC